jgi:hypothetical protein
MTRFYEPVAIVDGSDAPYEHYGVRGQCGHRNRVMGRSLQLDRDRADTLCDLLEEVRQYAICEAAERA